MISAIENAIIARLSSAPRDVLGYGLRRVDSYGGQLEAEDELAKIANVLPCALVTCTGVGRADDNGSHYTERGTFAVLCVARSLRNEQATRHGGKPGEVGTHQMRDDVLALLCGQTLGLGEHISPLVPHGTRILFNGKLRTQAISVVSVEFATNWNHPVPADAPQAALPENTQGATTPAEAVAKAAGITDFTLYAGDWGAPVPLFDGQPLRDVVEFHQE
ncbi:DUF1834 family protein [Nitratidesulfovibrio sp. HK-II]|uniref:phage protein Gp37 n=1 Tax=Nitratidesulfovibrio sp. HK-II TaxID=2009266 RepID=UPI003A7AACC7